VEGVIALQLPASRFREALGGTTMRFHLRHSFPLKAWLVTSLG
jgi:hypothetical protein